MPLITKTDSTGAVNGGAISSITKKIKGPCDEDEEQVKKKDSLTIDKSRGPLKRDLTLDSKKSSKSGKGSWNSGSPIRNWTEDFGPKIFDRLNFGLVEIPNPVRSSMKKGQIKMMIFSKKCQNQLYRQRVSVDLKLKNFTKILI